MGDEYSQYDFLSLFSKIDQNLNYIIFTTNLLLIKIDFSIKTVKIPIV